MTTKISFTPPEVPGDPHAPAPVPIEPLCFQTVFDDIIVPPREVHLVETFKWPVWRAFKKYRRTGKFIPVMLEDTCVGKIRILHASSRINRRGDSTIIVEAEALYSKEPEQV